MGFLEWFLREIVQRFSSMGRITIPIWAQNMEVWQSWERISHARYTT
ncbi:hypothetical protein ES705_04265 [subsurface metagenome]